MAKKLWKITAMKDVNKLQKGMFVEMMSVGKPMLSEIIAAIEKKYGVKPSLSNNSCFHFE